MPIVLVGESVAELERQLEALKQVGFGSPPMPVVDLDRKVRKLKQRATRTTGRVWELVVAAANLPEGEFTLDDVAQQMTTTLGQQVDVDSVKSWHRILGRPLKRLHLRVLEKVPGSASPARFTMPAEVRRAVLAA